VTLGVDCLTVRLVVGRVHEGKLILGDDRWVVAQNCRLVVRSVLIGNEEAGEEDDHLGLVDLVVCLSVDLAVDRGEVRVLVTSKDLVVRRGPPYRSTKCPGSSGIECTASSSEQQNV
jgi:hypothetical protein